MNRRKVFSNTIRQHKEFFITCWSIAPGFMAMHIFEAIKLEISIFFEHSFGIRYVISAAERHLPFQYSLFYLLGMMIAIAISTISFAMYSQWIAPRYKQKLYQNIKLKIYEKATTLKIKNYDDTDFYNNFILSLSESEKCIDRFLKTINLFFSDLTSIICFSIYLFYLDKGGVIFVTIVFISSLITSHYTYGLEVKERIQRNPLERKQMYLQRLFYLSDYAKDIRLNGAFKDILLKDFEETDYELQKINQRFQGKRFLGNFLKKYVLGDFIMCSLYAIYLVYQAICIKNISYSDMVILFMMARSFSGWFISMAETYPRLDQNAVFIKKIMDFLANETIEKKLNKKEITGCIKELELSNVCFGYSSDKPILNNINMKIKKGHKVAIVGNNGAGKSTLVSLIMRLYEVDKGEILINGQNVNNYKLEDYYKKIGVVFQDFNIYATSIRENVTMTNSQKTINDEQIRKSLEQVDFWNSHLKDYTLDTQLTTEFEENGIDLSGGEKQKITIARVVYFNADIVIMDEPSSALDPVAEYNFNKLLKNIAKDKIVIFISHRLSTTREADYIYVLEKGEIIEEGNHEKLLNARGKYSCMWNAQAGKYQTVE